MDAELAAVPERPSRGGIVHEARLVVECGDHLVDGDDAGDPRRHRHSRPGVQHLQVRLGAHAAHVDDEVFGTEVGGVELFVLEERERAFDAGCSLDPREETEMSEVVGVQAVHHVFHLRDGFELGHDHAGHRRCHGFREIIGEPLGGHRVHAHVDHEFGMLIGQGDAGGVRVGRAAILASAGTASSKSSTTPSGPLRGSLASTSGRLAGAKRRLRSLRGAASRAPRLSWSAIGRPPLHQGDAASPTHELLALVERMVLEGHDPGVWS